MDDFIALVSKMRSAQKQYFLRKTPGDLRAAKVLEAQVDESIYKWEGKQAEAAQPGLDIW